MAEDDDITPALIRDDIQGPDADDLPDGYSGMPVFENATFTTIQDAPDSTTPDWAQSREAWLTSEPPDATAD